MKIYRIPKKRTVGCLCVFVAVAVYVLYPTQNRLYQLHEIEALLNTKFSPNTKLLISDSRPVSNYYFGFDSYFFVETDRVPERLKVHNPAVWVNTTTHEYMRSILRSYCYSGFFRIRDHYPTYEDSWTSESMEFNTFCAQGKSKAYMLLYVHEDTNGEDVMWERFFERKKESQ